MVGYAEGIVQYQVPDRPISSEVAFQFEGSEGDGTLNWHALDGTRGILILKLQSAHALEVTWRVTEFGSHIGLGAGTAILIRRVE